jgi:hypothetical protein
MIHQLRIYEIEHNKAAFHDRFRDHAAPSVYLLAWPNEAEKNAAWATFMANEQWKEIKRVTSAKHGDLVGAIEDRVLVATAHSPSRV